MPMSNLSKLPLLILGQGIAGTTLALQCLRNNIDFVVVDRGTSKSASAVAAGLFNPFTGPQMKLTWNANVLFPALHEFYPWAEAFLGSSFFHPNPIFRPYLSVWEQNEITAKAAENSQFVGSEISELELNQVVNAPFSGLEVKQGGYVNTIQYLEAARNYLIANSLIQETEFEESKLEYLTDSIFYQGKQYAAIVYANGLGIMNSPFSFIPFKPNKGEVLIIKWDKKPSFIPNRKVYLVPQNEVGTYKVGATYANSFETLNPTQAGLEELTQNLGDLILGEWSVENHLAGVRPAMGDRKPVVGSHPKLPFTYVLGGFGAKGVTLAPWCANQLLNHLINAIPLTLEIDVLRFKNRFKE